jgi:hypothetical protein
VGRSARGGRNGALDLQIARGDWYAMGGLLHYVGHNRGGFLELFTFFCFVYIPCNEFDKHFEDVI